MQLVSMEVNQLGSADRTQVGELTAGLNAVCGRRGSGKSSLLAWLRGIIQPSNPADHYSINGVGNGVGNGASNGATTASGRATHPALASGRLNLLLGSGEYQLERQHASGRTDSKVLRRATQAWNGSAPVNYDDNWNSMQARLGAVPHGEMLTALQREAFDRLAAVRSDSQATYRLWDLARQLRLDESSATPGSEQRQSLLSREQELLAQLNPLDGIQATREGLLARRRQLEADLDRLRRQSSGKHYAPATDEHHRLSDRMAALDRDIQKLRDEIAEFDAAIARRRDGHATDTHRQTYRERLLSLDAQLARWRNTLTEIRAHRERLESAATDAQLDGQLGEQFTPINQATPRLALRSLEAQIVDARRHFDALVDSIDHNRHDARHELPQTLRLMQRELHEVCQQLSRHESLTTNRAMKDQILQLTRCENEMRQSIERLIAERGELLRTIANACHLSVEQVSVAYSDSCRCADHPHLDNWLSAISSGADKGSHLTERSGLGVTMVDELTELENRRSQSLARMEMITRDRQDCEARLRRLGVMPLVGGGYDPGEAEVLRDLDNVNEELLRLETRDRLRVDLTDVRRRLERLPQETEDTQSLKGRYLRHLAGLTGMPVDRAGQHLFRDQLRRDAYNASQYSYDRSDLNSAYGPQIHGTNGHGNGYGSVYGNGHSHGHHRPLEPGYQEASSLDRYGRFEPVRGHYVAGQDLAGTPDVRLARLEEVALRLVIVDVLAARGHHIPLILDETLDGLEGPRALTAVRYLAGHAQASRGQVVALTDDADLINAVKSVHGNVLPIVVSRAVDQPVTRPGQDVNRLLTAYANDFETDKWHEPEWAPPAITPAARPEAKKRWQLTERSEIHEVPSIGAPEAARLRALGIHRVGDLLDADANWLSSAAALPHVSADVIQAWQNECRLLVAMPQLRPFDARVLAGAGVRDHRQLSEMEPARLHERVENFLATERGKRIMRSGSPYELSRLTSWIASATRGSRESHNGASQHREQPSAFELDARSRPRRTAVQRADAAHREVPTYHIVERDEDRSSDESDSRNQRRRESRNRPVRGNQEQSRPERASRSSSSKRQSSGEARQKFYLELSSPVVDAPSIGDSMAQSLSEVGVHTINDLLSANAEELARDLGQPRVTAAIIRAWQEQSRLVCRIPNLRGHDAQILVACGVTTPEALCRMEPTALLAQTTAFASSTQGQRVLRGSAAPDLEEIKQWIQWAGQSRNLLAA